MGLGATACWGQLLSGHMGFAEEGLSRVGEGREGISQGRWEVRLGLGWGGAKETDGRGREWRAVPGGEWAGLGGWGC